MKKFSILILITLSLCLQATQADKKKKPKAKPKPDPINARGKDFIFKPPGIGKDLMSQVTAETPDKQGLGFGGLFQLKWNPDSGNYIKKGKEWVHISAQLKKQVKTTIYEKQWSAFKPKHKRKIIYGEITSIVFCIAIHCRY